MGPYRLYLYGGGDIRGRHDFDAEDDVGAVKVAELLFEACSDRCSAWELWQGARVVHISPKPCLPPLALGYVTHRMQQSVLDSEELILCSKWAIATSRRLLDRYQDLRSRDSHCA